MRAGLGPALSFSSRHLHEIFESNRPLAIIPWLKTQKTKTKTKTESETETETDGQVQGCLFVNGSPLT